MPEQTERDCELCRCERYREDSKKLLYCHCGHNITLHRSPQGKPPIKMTVDK